MKKTKMKKVVAGLAVAGLAVVGSVAPQGEPAGAVHRCGPTDVAALSGCYPSWESVQRHSAWVQCMRSRGYPAFEFLRSAWCDWTRL